MKKILLFIITIITAFYGSICLAAGDDNNEKGVVGIDSLNKIDSVKDVSMLKEGLNNASLTENANILGGSAIAILKTTLQGVLVIFLVYTGIMMVLSMGTNEEQLSSSKKQLYYALTGLLFINIPELLKDVFVTNNKDKSLTSNPDTFSDGTSISLLAGDNFLTVVSENVITFLEVLIFASAILMFILAGGRVISSRGKEENVTEGKFKFSYGLFGLFFVGLIEGFKSLVFANDLMAGEKLYQQLMQVGAYFLAPVAFFFITLGGYYYLLSGGDDSKMQKGKDIILYTVLGILIYISSVSILSDINF
ncbi:MAG: hypothetical protein N4A38_04475 [Candidatus Gracilibacteria bacterium]|nr:hypothetical protein [Candidatus Gracilibacteria bacterium]